LDIKIGFLYTTQGDTVFISNLELHAYVAIFLSEDGKLYVGDGSNDVLDNMPLIDRLKQVGTVVRLCYEFLTRTDFCGSAAPVLALHIVQCHKASTFKTCQPLPSLRRRIESRLHKHPSRASRCRLMPHIRNLECLGCNQLYARKGLSNKFLK
jgi:hypothetical protein